MAFVVCGRFPAWSKKSRRCRLEDLIVYLDAAAPHHLAEWVVSRLGLARVNVTPVASAVPRVPGLPVSAAAVPGSASIAAGIPDALAKPQAAALGSIGQYRYHASPPSAPWPVAGSARWDLPAQAVICRNQ